MGVLFIVINVSFALRFQFSLYINDWVSRISVSALVAIVNGQSGEYPINCAADTQHYWSVSQGRHVKQIVADQLVNKYNIREDLEQMARSLTPIFP